MALKSVPPLTVFVADDAGTVVGFIEVGIRTPADGCQNSPAPFVEGWYVQPDRRRGGIGRALMLAAEEWSRAQGYTELGSNTEDYNRLSRDAHAALGFEEVETLVMFRKPLR